LPTDVDYSELFEALCAEYAGVTGVSVPSNLAPRASRSTPPTSSSLAEERTPPLPPPPLGGARYRRSEPGLAPRRFGSEALKINNRIFAMLSGGRLVVKLPRARVAELIETGRGQPFDAGKGTPMKEWVALTGDESECRALVVEAQAFVG
jgi:hypothetical protein